MKAAVPYKNGGPGRLDVTHPACPPDGVVIRVKVVSVDGGDVLSGDVGPTTKPRTSRMNHMKAVVYYENGGPEVLRYEDVEEPSCPPGHVLIDVKAISVEGGDLVQRKDRLPPVVPYVAGSTAAGTIRDFDRALPNLTVGQQVVTIFTNGAYAERRAVPTPLVWTVPDGLDLGKAATVLAAFATANESLFHAGKLHAGETVLIHAGASGVGVASIQLAKRAGATVIATASDDDRLARLRRLGVDHTVNYRREDFVQAVGRLTGGRGVDLVVDSVGGTTLQRSLLAAAKGGRVVFLGNAGGEGLTIDLWPALRGNVTLRGMDIAAEMMTTRVHDVGQRYLEEAAKGEVEVLIDRTFPLAEAAAAHAYVESRAAVGRVLLVP